MTVANPPGFLQNAGATHTAEQFRNWTSIDYAGKNGATSLITRGGVNPNLGNQLSVTQTGSPSMAVLVKSGHAVIPGTEGSKQGGYSVFNDADVTLSIGAAHASLNRIDSVVFKVEDSAYSGANNTSSVVVVAGTPASSPAAPTLPANSIELARVSILANDTSITNGEITDRRFYLCGLGGAIIATSSTRPASTTVAEGQLIYETDTDSVYVWDGSATWNLVWTNGAWSVWVPTTTNITVGAGGVIIAKYQKVGKRVDYRFKFTLGTGSSISATPQFTLPAAPNADYVASKDPLGRGYLADSGVADYECAVRLVSGSTVDIVGQGTNGVHINIGAGTPFTFATGDSVSVSGTYEAA